MIVQSNCKYLILDTKLTLYHVCMNAFQNGTQQVLEFNTSLFNNIITISTMHPQEMHTLTWNRYSDHLREMVNEMMTSSQFADVTLVTDDKQLIRAHRNILGACSPVFKNILNLDSSIANPVIYLRGIQNSEMESIRQLIYQGKTSFNEERLSELLTVSKNLEIKELATVININDKTSVNEKTNENENKISDKIEDISKNLKLTLSDIALTKPQAQAVSFVANKSDYNSLSEESIFKCLDCERIFNAEQALSHHINIDHEGVKCDCNHCNYQAILQGNLTKHLQLKHKGVKYACNQCDKKFTQQITLTRHIHSIHEGVKYPCDQCGKQYTEEGGLRKHIKSKHEGFKYTCNQCGKQFSQQGNLTTHIQSQHEGVKYACDQCGKQFTEDGSLTRHIQSVHEGVKYDCNQ